MPTGYTACIGDGASFAKFMWTLARAFVVWCRDNDGPIPEKIQRHEVEWHESKLREARERLERATALSTREVDLERLRALEAKDKQIQEWRDRDARLRSQYGDMLALVEAWTPPTPRHERLKTYAIEEIRESIKYDCGERDWWDAARAELLVDAEEYRSSLVRQCGIDIEYHARHLTEAMERQVRDDEWLAALRASIPQPKE